MAYKDTVLADSPHIYYQWTANNGTPANTGSKTVTTTANALTAVTGVGGVEYAGSFNGTSSYLKAAGSANNTFNGTAWSIEAWFKRGTQTTFQEIVNVNDASNNLALLQWWGGADDKKIVALFKGNNGTQISAKSAAITDTDWHHVAATYSAGTLKLYLDGYEVASTSGGTTANFGLSTPVRIGAYGDSAGNENWAGTIDEVAVYSTALTPTKVLNRYTTYYPISVNAAGVTPGTASGLSVDPSVQIFRVASVTATEDQSNTGSSDGDANSTDLLVSGSTGTTFIKFPTVTLPQDAEISKIYLVLRKTSAFSSTISVGKVTSAWSESNWTTPPNPTRDMTSPATLAVSAATGDIYIDITSLGFNTNGYALAATSTVGIASTETATPPRLVVEYISDGAATNAAAPATGSGIAGDATVTAGANKTVAASVAHASGISPDASIVTASNPDVTFGPQPFSGSGLMVQAGLGAKVSSGVAIGSGAAVDAALTTEKNALVKPQAANATGYLEAPAEARNANDDLYFNYIRATTDADDAWYRLDETGGDVVHALTGGLGTDNDNLDAYLEGSYAFGISGPEGRRAIRFNNGFFENERTQISDEMTFEVVLRTTQKNGLIAYGLDASPTTNGTFRNTIYLTNGRVTFNGEYTGVKDVADGQWHHIVVAWGHGNENLLDDGMRIYIDGKLDLRRAYSNVPNGRFAAPDWYFGMPDELRPAAIPANFVGDVMEVVYRANGDLDQHEAQQLYYAAMGIDAIEVQPFTASGAAGDAKARGNQKRALMLYFDTKQWFTGAPNTSELAYGDNVATGDFDFGPLIPTPGMIGYAEKLQAAGYRVFFQSVDIQQGGKLYRDYVTDTPRLLDLEEDINVDDFDLLFYRNFPDEGEELDRLLNIGYTMQDLERHLQSLRNVVDKGVSLWISNPALANRMGIVSKVEFIPSMKEYRYVPQQGENQLNNWNEHAAAIDPWPSTEAYGYRDTHRNNRERIVAAVDGMTDIPAEIIVDALHWDVKQTGRYSNQYSLRFGKRPNGLLVGDEYVEPTMWWNDISEDQYYTVSGDDQYQNGLYAVPPTAVLAGTAVTKLGTYTWEAGNVQRANPYAEYVGTIVVQPGDNLKGRPVGGKILVTLSQDPRFGMFEGFTDWKRQLVPANELISNPLDHEGANKREWDFSTNRWIFGGSNTGANDGLTPVMNADGSISYVNNSGGNLSGVTLSEKYATQPVKVLSMIQRGLAWLSNRITTAPGEKNIRPVALTGNGSMPNPTITAQKSTTVNVTAALAIGQIVAPAEADTPDVSIVVLPLNGGGAMVNYEKKIVAAPFEGSATMQEIQEVAAQRDTIVVYLLRPEQITVFMEDN